jgi:hypothetical protein
MVMLMRAALTSAFAFACLKLRDDREKEAVNNT